MRDDGTQPGDAAVLAEADRLLTEQRAARDEAERRAFTERVMTAIAAEPVPRRFSRRRLLVIGGALAAVLALAFLLPGVWRTSRAEALLQARLAAEQYRVPRGSGPIAHPALSEHEGVTLVAVRYAYAGVRCLWLYPEPEILDWERNASEEELARHPRWRLPVSDGRIALPDAALENAFGDAEALVMMDLGAHIEIWPAEGLARHLSEARAPN